MRVGLGVWVGVWVRSNVTDLLCKWTFANGVFNGRVCGLAWWRWWLK